LPKFGFTSQKALTIAEILLHELEKVDADVIDIDALKKAKLIGCD
jgi:large subunit ribosomal protein L15